MGASRKLPALVPGLILLASPRLHACAVCFGDPESGMAKGAQAGVIFLVFMIYGLLMAMVGVAGYWIHRARKIAAAEAAGANSPNPDPPEP